MALIDRSVKIISSNKLNSHMFIIRISKAVFKSTDLEEKYSKISIIWMKTTRIIALWSSNNSNCTFSHPYSKKWTLGSVRWRFSQYLKINSNHYKIIDGRLFEKVNIFRFIEIHRLWKFHLKIRITFLWFLNDESLKVDKPFRFIFSDNKRGYFLIFRLKDATKCVLFET